MAFVGGPDFLRFAACRSCCGTGDPGRVQCGYFDDTFDRDELGPTWEADAYEIVDGAMQTALDYRTAIPDAINPIIGELGVVLSVSVDLGDPFVRGSQVRLFVNGTTAAGLHVRLQSLEQSIDCGTLPSQRDQNVTISIYAGGNRVAGPLCAGRWDLRWDAGLFKATFDIKVCMTVYGLSVSYRHHREGWSRGPSYNTTIMSTNAVAVGTGEVKGPVRFTYVNVSRHGVNAGDNPTWEVCGSCAHCVRCGNLATPDRVLVTVPVLPEKQVPPWNGTPCGNCASYAGQYVLRRSGIATSFGNSCFWRKSLSPACKGMDQIHMGWGGFSGNAPYVGIGNQNNGIFWGGPIAQSFPCGDSFDYMLTWTCLYGGSARGANPCGPVQCANSPEVLPVRVQSI